MRRREEKEKLRAGLVDVLADLQRARRADAAATTSEDASPATKRRDDKRKLRESLEDMLSDVRRAKAQHGPATTSGRFDSIR